MIELVLAVAMSIKVADVPIHRVGLTEAVGTCRDRVRARHGGYVCFVNVHSLTEATRHHELREALTRASYCFADGMPLVWLSRLKGKPISSRVGGPDFMAMMLELEHNHLHGFIGGAPGQANIIASRFGVRSVSYAPPRRELTAQNAVDDWNAFLDQCPARQPPAIVWVGLGAPKQELWLSLISRLAPNTMFFGVGAAFDFLSGLKARAPRWMQQTGLEWAHRLAHEPNRLWRRYLRSNLRFAKLVMSELVDEEFPSSGVDFVRPTADSLVMPDEITERRRRLFGRNGR